MENYLVGGFVIVQWLVVVLLVSLLGRWFANFYVSKTERPDQWWWAFCATGGVGILSHTLTSAVLLITILGGFS